jgi:hypothetical protein
VPWTVFGLRCIGYLNKANVLSVPTSGCNMQTPDSIMLQLAILHKTWLGALIVRTPLLRAYLKNYTFSKGKRYDNPNSKAEIMKFIEEYDVDMDEVAKPIETYRTLNEFFYRAHRPGARPVLHPECVSALQVPHITDVERVVRQLELLCTDTQCDSLWAWHKGPGVQDLWMPSMLCVEG